MKVELWCLNKSPQNYVNDGIADFSKRIGHYLNFEIQYYSAFKSTGRMSLPQVKKAEAKLLLSKKKAGDHIILLDEKGKEYTSVEFAGKLEKLKLASYKRVIFIIGGGYGFDESLRTEADHIISLSKMTFPHDLVRVIFLEQLYRACTIGRGEKYHHA